MREPVGNQIQFWQLSGATDLHRDARTAASLLTPAYGPPQLANDLQSKRTTGPEAGIGVSKIVKDTFEARATRYCLPRVFQISARLLGIIARHDVRANSFKTSQHCKRRSV
jgi:hypothetical protein